MLNIDDYLYIEGIQKVLRANEETKCGVSAICFECAYRETSISHCWYLMTTGKTNKLEGNKCRHFVNREVLREFIDEYNNKNSME